MTTKSEEEIAMKIRVQELEAALARLIATLDHYSRYNGPNENHMDAITHGSSLAEARKILSKSFHPAD